MTAKMMSRTRMAETSHLQMSANTTPPHTDLRTKGNVLDWKDGNIPGFPWTMKRSDEESTGDREPVPPWNGKWRTTRPRDGSLRAFYGAMRSSNSDSCCPPSGGKQPVQRPEPESRIRHLQLYAGDPFREEAPQVAGHREDPEFLELCVSNIHLEQVVIWVLSGFQCRPEMSNGRTSLGSTQSGGFNRNQDFFSKWMLQMPPP